MSDGMIAKHQEIISGSLFNSGVCVCFMRSVNHLQGHHGAIRLTSHYRDLVILTCVWDKREWRKREEDEMLRDCMTQQENTAGRGWGGEGGCERCKRKREHQVKKRTRLWTRKQV